MYNVRLPLKSPPFDAIIKKYKMVYKHYWQMQGMGVGVTGPWRKSSDTQKCAP